MNVRLLAPMIVALPLLVVSASSAHAQPSPDRQLVHQYKCRPMAAAIKPPVEGYLVDDVSDASGLFHAGSGELTSGLLVGRGGTWELRYQCKR